MVIISRSESDTHNIGFTLGRHAKPGDIILLSGELGVGKTSMAKGIVNGTGATETVTSPTFTLMNQYKGVYPVYHFDIYRLSEPDELYDLDYEEYFYGDGITIVEWPEKLGDLMPDDYLKITIERTSSDNERRIKVFASGPRYNNCMEALEEYENSRT